MRFREWLHPHRQLLLALVAVAVVSAGALGWLGWLLVQQDAAMARQPETDRLQQQAETAAAALRASLADLPRLAGASTAASSSLHTGVLRVELTTRGVVVRGELPVLWVPHESGTAESPAAGLGAAESREFSGDLPGALNAYMLMTRERPRDATAVSRVARVERKLRRSAAALATYDRLERLSTTVDDLPPSLVARVGRASVHADTRDLDSLRREAGALRDDLLSGRWPISRTIWVRLQQAGTEVEIVVRDNGLGIPAKEQSGGSSYAVKSPRLAASAARASGSPSCGTSHAHTAVTCRWTASQGAAAPSHCASNERMVEHDEA